MSPVDHGNQEESVAVRHLPGQWRGALVVNRVEPNQGGGTYHICLQIEKSVPDHRERGRRSHGGRRTSASERVSVGEACVELRPWRSKRVERPLRPNLIDLRSFSPGGSVGGGGGHCVGNRGRGLSVHIQISPPSFIIFLPMW
jgi:hypothetical protein